MPAPILNPNDKEQFQSIIGFYQQYFTLEESNKYSPLIVVILYDDRELTTEELAQLAELQLLVNKIWEEHFQ